MTEKHYGGQSGFGFNPGKVAKQGKDNNLKEIKVKANNRKEIMEEDSSEMTTPEAVEKIRRAGKIAIAVKKYAREIIKPGMKLIDIAYKIDDKIVELGGKYGFPVNLSIDDVAAHFTPNFNCEQTARGLLKVDVGVQIDGYIADTAFSMNLEEGEEGEENIKLIKASEEAVKKSTETFGLGVELGNVGKAIQETIESHGFNSIKNLSGHSIERYNIHAGWTVPNYDSGDDEVLEPGLYATEPFATNGEGMVRDGAGSGIYKLEEVRNVRDTVARNVLSFIFEEFKTLPFCHRWIHKEFGARGLIALNQLEREGIVYQYPQLIEVSGGRVAQTEHNVLLLENGEKIVSTRE